MKTIGIVMSPFMPFPCVKGGAVETLMQFILDENEKYRLYHFVFFVQDNFEARTVAEKYLNSEFVFIKNGTKFSKIKFQVSRLFFKFFRIRPYIFDDFHRTVYQFLRKHNVDLLIVEGGSAVFEYKKISILLGKNKMVLHLHATFYAPHCVDAIFGQYIAISEYVKKIWLKNAENPCKVLKNAIDDKFFNTIIENNQKRDIRANLNISEDVFLIVYCGRLIPEKGIKELCLAVAQKNNVKLLVIGSPNFGIKSASNYEKEIHRIALLSKNIFFTGYIPNKALPAYYQIANLVAVPSLWEEGCGMVCVEAMASGLPVLATESGGMPEYLLKEGTLFCKRNEKTIVSELSDKIDFAVENQDLLVQMGNLNRKNAKLYSSSTYYKNFCELLQEILSVD